MKTFLERYWLVLGLVLLAIVILVILLSGGRTDHSAIKAAAKTEKMAHIRADSLLAAAHAAVAGSRADSAAAATLDYSARLAADRAAFIRHQTHTHHVAPIIPRTRPDSARYYNRLFAD